MAALGSRAHAVAIDLPGVGGSEVPLTANDKRSIARCVHEFIGAMKLRNVTLVGHDVGGQIAYAYLHEYPRELAGAVLMNIVIPGIDPWAEVIRNPAIFHFAFHAVPELPERLIAGREAIYFGYFFDVLSARRDGVPREVRNECAQAYSRLAALKTGFDWYRAFKQDEQDNARTRSQSVDTPVLYLRGDKEHGDIDRYVAGLRGGLRNVRGHLIPDSGHFAPNEQPVAVADLLAEFVARRD
jgi:pimeloyl-ACP methyl ester carboxylesterase